MQQYINYFHIRKGNTILFTRLWFGNKDSFWVDNNGTIVAGECNDTINKEKYLLKAKELLNNDSIVITMDDLNEFGF